MFGRSGRCRLGAGAVGFQLEQHLVVLNHAELASRAFFDGFEAGLEIADISIECIVSRFQLFIRLVLLRKLTIVFPDLQPTALAEPHRILQRYNERNQDVGKNTHESFQRRLKKALRPA
jgi:hypothetical protein